MKNRAARLTRLIRADRGSVATTVAVAIMPLMLGIGAAVDAGRAYVVQSRLSDALDAAGLAVGSSSGTTAQLQAVGQNFFNANFPNGMGTVTSFNVNVTSDTITVTGSAKLNTTFMKLAGINTLNVSSSNQIKRALTGIEIALVLDNTGSMAGTKITTLKTAASNFVDTMSTAVSQNPLTNSVKISMVPYTMTVNVGPQYKTAPWIDQQGASPINDQIFTSHANRLTLFKQMGVAWQGCVESRPSPYNVQDTAPTTAVPATLFVPYFAPDEPDNDNSFSHSSGFVNNYLPDQNSGTWQQRQGNPNKYTTAPNKTGTNSIGYQYGPNSGCIVQPLVRLTTDFNSVKTGINGMVAGGDTNINAGVVWGWHTLSPNAPFADGAAYNNTKAKKFMVLMTDGENHNAVANNSDQAYYGGLGYWWQGRLGVTTGTGTQRQVALDNLLLTTCANVKAAGITVYTIAVEVVDGATGLMQQCASTPDKYFDVTNVAQLDSTFQAIAKSITNLRVAQ